MQMITRLKADEKTRITLGLIDSVESLPVREVVCLEAQSNYVKAYLKNEKSSLTRKTLKEFDVELCGQDTAFMRVHNSFIINLNHVLRYLKTLDLIVMSNEMEVPLSKSRREDFFKWLDVK
jgi:two-component system LytT family response regulator